jgi:EAL domain-containing protein (putative c-di-GMP-specific phosphodiesterase class I)/CheY-like chemotaxis protein
MMPRILIVDDDFSVRHMLNLMLQRSGFNVDEAQDGAEAMRKAIKNSYDAAIVDYRMPPPDGVEVLTHLRDIQPRCARILTSGSLDLPLVMTAINRGEVSKVVQKPFSRQAILNALGESIAARTRFEEICLGARSGGLEEQRRHLEECLSDDLLTLALQPIVSARDGSVRGYEALLRSTHRDLNTPLRVIGAAEVHGTLGRVADRVAFCARRWLDRLPADVNMFINVHPRELAEVEQVRQRLEGLRPWSQRIVLEITERSDVLQMDSWHEALEFVTEAGFRFAVDDVGCGYNSLAVLAELRPAFMKVDRSMVQQIERDEHKQRLLELLATFAHATGIKLIVEGIETEMEATVVRRIGADLLQGYLFGRPGTPASHAMRYSTDS